MNPQTRNEAPMITFTGRLTTPKITETSGGAILTLPVELRVVRPPMLMSEEAWRNSWDAKALVKNVERGYRRANKLKAEVGLSPEQEAEVATAAQPALEAAYNAEALKYQKAVSDYQRRGLLLGFLISLSGQELQVWLSPLQSMLPGLFPDELFAEEVPALASG